MDWRLQSGVASDAIRAVVFDVGNTLWFGARWPEAAGDRAASGRATAIGAGQLGDGCRRPCRRYRASRPRGRRRSGARRAGTWLAARGQSAAADTWGARGARHRDHRRAGGRTLARYLDSRAELRRPALPRLARRVARGEGAGPARRHQHEPPVHGGDAPARPARFRDRAVCRCRRLLRRHGLRQAAPIDVRAGARPARRGCARTP